MALEYRLSEVQNIRLLVQDGVFVLELQMKYIRYQLWLDNEVMRQELVKILEQAAVKGRAPAAAKPLPRFYKQSGGG